MDFKHHFPKQALAFGTGMAALLRCDSRAVCCSSSMDPASLLSKKALAVPVLQLKPALCACCCQHTCGSQRSERRS